MIFNILLSLPGLFFFFLKSIKENPKTGMGIYTTILKKFKKQIAQKKKKIYIYSAWNHIQDRAHTRQALYH
jgi:hypothetical protein